MIRFSSTEVGCHRTRGTRDNGITTIDKHFHGGLDYLRLPSSGKKSKEGAGKVMSTLYISLDMPNCLWGIGAVHFIDNDIHHPS